MLPRKNVPLQVRPVEGAFQAVKSRIAPSNGGCVHYVMVSNFQWKPFWLATQQDPQNYWTATQNGVNYDVFIQAPFSLFRAGFHSRPVGLSFKLIDLTSLFFDRCWCWAQRQCTCRSGLWSTLQLDRASPHGHALRILLRSRVKRPSISYLPNVSPCSFVRDLGKELLSGKKSLLHWRKTQLSWNVQYHTHQHFSVKRPCTCR